MPDAIEAGPELSFASYRYAGRTGVAQLAGSLRATMPVSLGGVDDHGLIRDGVKAIFDRGSECGAVGESENSAEAVQLCRKSRPDIILMDIGLLGSSIP